MNIFNVHGSVHRNNILVYNSNKMHKPQSLFYLTTALHVSGVTITHLQEHKTTVTAASGNRFTVLLSAAYATHNTLKPVATLPRQQFKTLFYVVRHLDSIVSYLPIGLHLGFFRSWPSLYLPSSFSSVFLVLF